MLPGKLNRPAQDTRIMRKKANRQSRKDQLEASLFALTRRCPVDQCNPVDCLLYSVRKMKPSARLLWLRAVTEEDLDFIAAYHHVCMKVKLAESRIMPTPLKRKMT
jgi:hypothetical protein